MANPCPSRLRISMSGVARECHRHPATQRWGHHPRCRGGDHLVSRRPGRSNDVMGAVGMLAGREIRRQWRSTLAIALLIGVVGALVLATVAGARRSTTSLSRFNEVSRSADLELSIDRPTARELAEFRRSPGVAEVSHLRGYTLESPTLPNLAIAAPLDDVLGRSLDRDRLVAGRRPDQK